jgi:hypothetical protein
MKTMQILSRALTAAALIAVTTSCGSVVRDSRAPVVLLIDSLAGIRGGASTASAAASLTSDVLTIVTSGGTCSTTTPCPTVFGDSGTVTVHTVLKDIGLPGTTITPSTNNQVTISRIHVAYRRTDGRNQEGVDVPYAFDVAVTATIGSAAAVPISFDLVRLQAKTEAPLASLVTNGQVISAIADVTLYGTDAVGNALSVTGSLTVNFANFGD